MCTFDYMKAIFTLQIDQKLVHVLTQIKYENKDIYSMLILLQP